jgi:integration host factor subunit beta
MTKSQLIAQLAHRFPHLYQRDIETLVKTVFEEISTGMVAGDRVELRGFGAFSIRKRDPRVARNPKNGESVKVNSRFAIYFRAGKELRERINKGKA